MHSEVSVTLVEGMAAEEVALERFVVFFARLAKFVVTFGFDEGDLQSGNHFLRLRFIVTICQGEV